MAPPIDTVNKLLEKAYATLKRLELSGNDAGVVDARTTTRKILKMLSVPAQTTDQIPRLVAYNTHDALFDSCIRRIWASWYDGDFSDGSGDQGEAMCEIQEDIGEWMHTLWTALQRSDGKHISLIKDSLLLCHDVAKRVDDTPSRTPFEDCEGDVSVENEQGVVVFEGCSYGGLIWMWRELLVVSGALGQDTSLVMKAIQDVGLDGEVSGMDVDEYDGHWNETQKSVAKGLLSSLDKSFRTHG